jgi:hypothetical protein
MTKKELLKRIKNLEKQLIDNGFGYLHDTNDESGEASFHAINYSSDKKNIHNRIYALADEIGVEFKYNPNRDKEVILAKKEKKKN